MGPSNVVVMQYGTHCAFIATGVVCATPATLLSVDYSDLLSRCESLDLPPILQYGSGALRKKTKQH